MLCDCGRRTRKLGSNYLPDRRAHAKKRLLCHRRASAGALNARHQLRLKLVCSKKRKFVQLLGLDTKSAFMIDDRKLSAIPKDIARISITIGYQFVKRNNLANLRPC